MEPLDRKFEIKARSVKGNFYTSYDAILFLAKDDALIPTLEFYKRECERLGAEQAQIKGLDLLIERVKTWRQRHPSALKIADVTPGNEEEILLKENEL